MPIVSPAKIGLYVHFPWCVKKCPYCDFNSHELRNEELLEDVYVQQLIRDFEIERSRASAPISTIFLGGGTPSLFSAAAIARLLASIDYEIDAEITMEINPGTLETASKFETYLEAGVNRISIGVQSFSDEKLRDIGRIHGSAEAKRAATSAKQAGFERINVDLMYGLPNQSFDDALKDLNTAVELDVEHISWYQLTIEPNTIFAKKPPKLPDHDELADMSEAGVALLTQAVFNRYEVSAFSKPDCVCRHNTNYWEFGDYIGIGAGAHGKLSFANCVTRSRKRRQPNSYMANLHSIDLQVESAELAFEFMLNVLRLQHGVDRSLFEERTGLPWEEISDRVDSLVSERLLDSDRLKLTPFGYEHLDDVVARFLPEVVLIGAAEASDKWTPTKIR